MRKNICILGLPDMLDSFLLMNSFSPRKLFDLMILEGVYINCSKFIQSVSFKY
jgi:hypothetical protein